MLHHVATLIDYGDTHGLFDLFRLLDGGFDDLVCDCQSNHVQSSPWYEG
jgi:hypothetical protein